MTNNEKQQHISREELDIIKDTAKEIHKHLQKIALKHKSALYNDERTVFDAHSIFLGAIIGLNTFYNDLTDKDMLLLEFTSKIKNMVIFFLLTEKEAENE